MHYNFGDIHRMVEPLTDALQHFVESVWFKVALDVRVLE